MMYMLYMLYMLYMMNMLSSLVCVQVHGLHFYTLNREVSTISILTALGREDETLHTNITS